MSHDLGDALVMICLITSIGGALKDDSSDVKPRLVLLSTQPSASRQADSSRKMFPLTTCGRGVHVGLSYAVGDSSISTLRRSRTFICNDIDCYINHQNMSYYYYWLP